MTQKQGAFLSKEALDHEVRIHSSAVQYMELHLNAKQKSQLQLWDPLQIIQNLLSPADVWLYLTSQCACQMQQRNHSKWQVEAIAVEVKVEVCSPVSSISAALLTLHNYLLVTGPCSLISHLNSLGSIQPGSHKFWHTQLITHSSLLSSYQEPTFHSWVEMVHV